MKPIIRTNGLKNHRNDKEEKDHSPCPKCEIMTKSVRLGRAKYVCERCETDKSLSDVYYYEATNKLNITKE